jgi:predicted metal-dependent hydrolase
MADLLSEGINFFNSGRYFEAHERWEDLWRITRGPLRLFYQGLIQAAVGLHHLSQGNLNGGRAQITKSVAKLSEYPALFCRIDNEKLVGELRQILVNGKIAPIVIVRQSTPVIESKG